MTLALDALQAELKEQTDRADREHMRRVNCQKKILLLSNTMSRLKSQCAALRREVSELRASRKEVSAG